MLNKIFRLQYIKYFFLFFIISKATIAAVCGDDRCTSCKYGFRRAYVSSAKINLIDHGGPWDAEVFLRDMAGKAETLRNELIRTKAFGDFSEAKIKEEIESTFSRNVASFTFIFFDDKGNTVTDIPYFHFQPNATKDNVDKPFFFFSGRRHRIYDSSTDIYLWDALSEATVKEGDIALHKIGSILDARKEAFQAAYGEGLYFVSNIAKSLQTELDRMLYKVCEKEDFFDYLKMRERGKRLVKKESCVLYASPCVPNVTDLKFLEPGTSSRTTKPVTHFLPLEDTGDFTHSEQFALYKMRDHLGIFIDACFEKIGTSVASIRKLVILIYTRNTMCARCSHSIVADFCHSGDDPSRGYTSFIHLINRKIAEKTSTITSIPALFLASAWYPYVSNKLVQIDNFERLLRRETTGASSGGAGAGTGTAYDDGLRDMTYNPHVLPKFDDEPKMIFHHHMNPI